MKKTLTRDLAFAEIWLRTFSSQTARNYRTDIVNFIQALPCPLSRVETSNIQDYLQHAPLASDIIRRRTLFAIKGLYRFAMAENYVKRDPAATLRNIVPEPARTTIPRTLSVEEVLRLLEETRNDREYTIIGLAYYGALSATEISGLVWSDFGAWKDDIVVIVRTPPRTRSVIIPQPLWQRMLRLRGEVPDDYPVLQSRMGPGLRPLQPRSILRMIHVIAERAGLPATGPQMLRYSHAQHALTRGATTYAVRESLGLISNRTVARFVARLSGQAASSSVLPKPTPEPEKQMAKSTRVTAKQRKFYD